MHAFHLVALDGNSIQHDENAGQNGRLKWRRKQEWTAGDQQADAHMDKLAGVFTGHIKGFAQDFAETDKTEDDGKKNPEADPLIAE